MTYNMLWIDLETTGLNAQEEVPLELGLKLTDEWGSQGPSKSWLIREATPYFKERLTDAQFHPIVGPMHFASGLWNDLMDWNRTNTKAIVEEEAIHFLKAYAEPGTLPLCGNSIGSLDRPFLLQHFPMLNEAISYRNIDVSTLKELCKRLNPSLFDSVKNRVENKEEAKHRVLEDIEASIVEYKIYVDWFLNLRY